ncbi:MAG: hypothetical protein JF593_10460 [Novosphingobium sp.]|nr:hypothetical protein [Novosphingobium sp.]
MATVLESTAVEKLTSLVDSNDRYDIPYAELREAQIAAMNERFQQRKDQIKLLRHRAEEAGLEEIGSLDDAVQLLFPHTAYKSYPESFLMDQRWDRMSKWLDTVSSYRVPVDKVKDAPDVDGWLANLEREGFFVSCSSGTTGKSAMLVASAKDMEWVKREAPQAYAWGSGTTLDRDRQMFGMAPVAYTPRNHATGEAYTAKLQDPNSERFAYPVPPITVGDLTKMVVLRKKIAEGTATPSEIEDMEATSAARQKAVDDAVGITAQALVEARAKKIHITGLWKGLYDVAVAVRALGYSGKDFNPENSIYVGGGLKRAKLPDDYREFVYETFNIRPERNYQNYSMQELHSGMPRCQKGNRYHIPPWVVPMLLNKDGDALLPMGKGEVEGRAAFFDLSIDGRWGGVISGDKIAIEFGTCACGHRGPSVRDDIQRYADLEGDDKIGCAGTVDAYVRGAS